MKVFQIINNILDSKRIILDEVLPSQAPQTPQTPQATQAPQTAQATQNLNTPPNINAQIANLQKQFAQTGIQIVDLNNQKNTLTKNAGTIQDQNVKAGVIKQIEGINDQLVAVTASKQTIQDQIAALQASLKTQAKNAAVTPKSVAAGTNVAISTNPASIPTSGVPQAGSTVVK